MEDFRICKIMTYADNMAILARKNEGFLVSLSGVARVSQRFAGNSDKMTYTV